MTSINVHPTFCYSQPDEYHFSHDSVFLAQRVFQITAARQLLNTRVLDLCAGCGVVGLDYLFHLHQTREKLPMCLDFIDVQTVYDTHLKKNTQLLNLPVASDFYQINYDQVFHQPGLKEKYNIVICNPPYFRKGQGALSPSDFKNRCRFYLDSDFKTLIQAIAYLLKPQGVAFVLIQDLKSHGVSIHDEVTNNSSGLSFQKIEKIRQTDLYQFTRLG